METDILTTLLRGEVAPRRRLLRGVPGAPALPEERRLAVQRAHAAPASLPRASKKPYSPHRSPPSSPPRAPRARRLDTCASTFGALPLPRARAPPRSLRTHHDVRASASRKGGRRARIARGHAPARPRSLLSHPDRWHVAEASRSVGRTFGGARSVARSIARSFPSVMTGVARSEYATPTSNLGGKFLCPRFPLEGS